MRDPAVRSAPLAVPDRNRIHDLRNLFGVVASARHLLDDRPSNENRAQLLDAIEAAAIRGGQLATDLLAASAMTIATFDVNARIAGLATMILALAGPHISVEIDLRSGYTMAQLDAGAFDAALLELVANARTALSSHIAIRTRCSPSGVRLTVADDGRGMNKSRLICALRGFPHPAAHGTGLGRVDHFVRQSRGRLRIRSSEHHGTVVSMSLPTVPNLAVDEPRSVRCAP